MINSAVTCKLRLWYIIVYQKVIIKSNIDFLEISNTAYIILM